MKRLEGRSALVTGAASGIGRATALLFAQHGASVACVDRAETLEETVALIRKEGGRALALNCDVADEASLAAAVQSAIGEHDGLHVCYANAGVGSVRPLADELDLAEWHRVLDVNLVGAFFTVKHAARWMVQAGKGSIICTASVAGLRSGAGGLPYSASKAGVISLVQTMANQLAGTGVRINAICPGLIETQMTRILFERARAQGTEHRIGQLNPLRRAGRPDEVAHAALFLASDDSSYVHGVALPVDGGLSSSLPTVIR